MKIVLSILLVGFAYNISAQTGISGKVTDSKNNPLEAATIGWQSTNIGTITGEKGEYALPRSIESDTLFVSSIGYETQKIFVDKHKSRVEIVLSESSISLDDVEVTARQRAEVISKINPVKSEVLSTASLERLPCCHLAASFENTLSVDKTYTDAVTGTEEIKMLGLAGVYSQILSEEVPAARGLSSTFGLHIPGAFLNSIGISKGIGSVISGYEGITGQIQMFLKQQDNAENFFANLYATSNGGIDINLYKGFEISDKWSTMLFLHGSSHFWKFDRNNNGFIDAPTGFGGNISQTFKYENEDLYRHQLGYKIIYKDSYGGQMDFDKDKDRGTTNYYGVGIVNERYEGFSNQMFRFENIENLTAGIKMNYVHFKQNSFFGLTEYNGTENNFNLSLNIEKGWEMLGQKLNFGGSFMYDEYDEKLSLYNFDRKEVVPGVFAEYTIRPIEQLTFIAGLRTDFHNIFGTYATPRFHLKYDAAENTVFRLLAGKGYRVANPVIDNIGLMASSRTWELPKDNNALLEEAWSFGGSMSQTFTVAGKGYNIELDYNRVEFLQKMITDLDTDPQSVMFYDLDGRSFADYVQAQISFEPIKQFEIKLAGRYNNVKETYGGELRDKLYNPKLKALFVLSYATDYSKWQFDVTNQMIGKARLTYIENADYKEYSPAYYQLHSQITRRFKYFDIYVAGENLTNYTQKDPIISADNPFSEEFDATRIWAPVVGVKVSAGIRLKIN